ncbi:large-conductance mechanosensitive channel [Sulfuriferula plumbiphila]|uniref:Large-conductance mechanosensitive channel n=1 Tax=Sulfuriferula plumbiphila TaxID=171865 RepID=A0A512LBE1_9PROT|nr:large conductance mechanosensitive channel protein MscL [Sulfuriferula plumbiphila]BBP06059.1 large-conductance mechanosensitive channel [Sulfuriferula plumbiphila]GEP31799.1 large-conductance mechanosensitive channel [Sulfuriferula plumbiphila]
MSFVSEFKAFAIKGNVVDLAIAVIIGGAFGKIVDSFVKDIVMPVIGQLVGGVDFKELYINLGSKTYDTLELAEKAGSPLIKYGVFINSVVNFTIIALAIFVALKAMSKLQKSAPPAAPAAPPEEVLLLREIRDSLKK